MGACGRGGTKQKLVKHGRDDKETVNMSGKKKRDDHKTSPRAGLPGISACHARRRNETETKQNSNMTTSCFSRPIQKPDETTPNVPPNAHTIPQRMCSVGAVFPYFSLPAPVQRVGFQRSIRDVDIARGVGVT
jgi:hypothetical protein